MVVSYTLSLEDYISCQMYKLRTDRAIQKSLYMNWLVATILASVGPFMYFRYEGWNYGVSSVVAAVIGLPVAVLFPFMWRKEVERRLRASITTRGTKGVLGPITLVLSEESLVEITETTRSEIKWENIKGVEEVGDSTYIDINGLLSAILPRLGFDSDMEYYAVRDFALRKLSDREPDPTAAST